MEYSYKNRAHIIEESKKRVFDIIIIGGGITGAGISLDAASRGLSVLLVEKDDFAQGTSSKSTKLVHGGLRYMKNLEFNLVHEAGSERSILYQNAPHIVFPQKMILPIYKGVGYSKWITSFGLWIYDLLAGVESKYKKRTLNISKTLEKIPLLNKNRLKGAIQYYEYRTNDARLVIENIKKSNDFGALNLNYTKAITIDNANNNEVRINLKDQLTGDNYNVKSKFVINATGIWSDELIQGNSLSKKTYILPSKGIHIVIDRKKANLNTAVYFELDDQRMVFAIPKDKKIIIGTTDDAFKGNNDEVFATSEEIAYLLKAFNQFFNIELSIDDIESTWAGIRPLVKGKTSDLNKVSRKEKIIFHTPNILSVLGGKLTAYRLVSEKVVNKVVKLLPEPNQYKKCYTKNIPLSGSEFDFGEIEDYKIIAFAEQKFNEAYQLNTNTDEIYGLFYCYGKNLELIINKAYDLYNSLDDKKTALLEAEIWYVTHYEMTIKLSDFLSRRTDRLYFRLKESLDQLSLIASLMAKYLEWSEETKALQIKEFKEIANKSHFLLMPNH